MGVCDSCELMDSGRLALKALRQLMVRGMPLKLMHFRPTSRMNSAVARLSLADWEVLASWYSSVRDSGEFIVMVVAVYWG